MGQRFERSGALRRGRVESTKRRLGRVDIWQQALTARREERLDHAVALVQTYLQLNGYFTSAEYALLERTGKGGYRTFTDIDMLAFRFPGGNGRDNKALPLGVVSGETDPGLDVDESRIDMIIGEVKEGRVNINLGALHPDVLRAAICRFGCPPAEMEAMVQGLLESGAVSLPSGFRIRLIAFGAMPPGDPVPPCRIISLGHVLRFLQRFVRENWKMMRHCQFKDPALGFLMTLEKARRGRAGRRGRSGVEVVSPNRNPSGRRNRGLNGKEGTRKPSD